MPTHFLTVPVSAALRQAQHPPQSPLRPVALVVDDDPVITSTLAAILNGSGLAAIPSPDARHALETAQVIPPQILIADLALPDMNGFNLALDVTQAVPDCAVILICGPDQHFDPWLEIDSLGIALRILVKPVRPADLLQAVQDLLARSRAPLQAARPIHAPDVFGSYSSAS